MMEVRDTMESEQALLGALMFCSDVADEIQSLVAATDFADTGLGRTFGHLLDMRDAGKPIDDARVVTSELREAGLLAAVGGVAGLARIAHGTPNAANAAYYAKEIRRASSLRQLAHLGKRLIEASQNPSADPSAVIRSIEAMASQLNANAATSLVSIEQATRDAIDRMRSASASKGPAIPTGLFEIDARLGGFFPGDLCVLAARPSIGKSALAAQIAMNVARKGRPVLLVSLEMDGCSIAARELSAELNTEVRRIRSGLVTEQQLVLAEDYADELHRVPLQIFFGRSATVSQVRGLARLMAAKPAGLGLITIDYLGLLTASDRRKPRWEQVSEVSNDMKSLALELNVPLLAACQLSRDAEGHAPTLNQLRDSGAIEQDSDQVWLLHRESRDATQASLCIAKNRNGPTFEVQFRFNPMTTRFSE